VHELAYRSYRGKNREVVYRTGQLTEVQVEKKVSVLGKKEGRQAGRQEVSDWVVLQQRQ
jgi:hypothetical protein